MLLLLRNSTLASSFRLKPSVLPVATRHCLTTSASPSPSQTQKAIKPHRYTKKELQPSVKRPMGSFIAFSMEKVEKHRANSDAPVAYTQMMRDLAVEWKKLSEAEKKSYAPPPAEYEAYRESLKKWYEGLSEEARKALKIRRRRHHGTGLGLYMSETFKDAIGHDWSSKMAERNATWKSLGPEKREEYRQRAAVTSFGVQAKRARIRARQLERAEKAKAAQKEKKRKLAEKKKALKANEAKKAAERKAAEKKAAEKKAAVKKAAVKKPAEKAEKKAKADKKGDAGKKKKLDKGKSETAKVKAKA